MMRVQCKGCDYQPSQYDTLEGYCMTCAGVAIRERDALKQRVAKLEAEKEQWKNELTRIRDLSALALGK